MTVVERLIISGSEVTTGSITNTYWRNNSGVVEFLQSGGTAWGATAFNFPCAYSAAIGFANLTVNAPASAAGFIIHHEVTHSVYGVVATGEHYVHAVAELSIRLVP